MRAARATALAACASAALFLSGCVQGCQAYNLRGYEADIRAADRRVTQAADDVQRAKALAERGQAYGEKARYGRSFKLISREEYERLFSLALADHDRAIALAPGDAEPYFLRGKTCYFRGFVEDMANDKETKWYREALADHTKAIERDPRHALALDMRGLVHIRLKDHDKAIADFQAEERVDQKMGRIRLAEGHCLRGNSHREGKRFALAVADFERSIDYGAGSDGCSCEPFNPLVGIYIEQTHEYDKAWKVVRRARTKVAPEHIANLEKITGGGPRP